MKIHHVTFNAKSAVVAYEIWQSFSRADPPLKPQMGNPRFSNDLDLPRVLVNTLQGVSITIPFAKTSDVLFLIQATFTCHWYGIHSVTVGNQTCLAEHITPDWWCLMLQRHTFRPDALEREVGI